MRTHPRICILIVCVHLVWPGAADSRAAGPKLKSGIDRKTFDTSIKPGDDFFQYVNGQWIKENPIPPEYSRWGAFPKLRDDNLIALREILEGLDKIPASLDENRLKLRDFYRTAMNEKEVQKLGASPLDKLMKQIDSVDSPDKLIVEAARLRDIGISTLFSFYVDQDEKQSERYAAHVSQGGMGLPDRDYYVGDSADSRRIRKLYREHVAKMLELLGDKPQAASAGADTVLNIETKLAEASRTPVQLRDREANYNKMSMAELAAKTPNVNWDLYLDTLDVTDAKYMIVGQPEFFERVNELAKSVSPKEWRTYLRWHLVHSMAPYLSSPFEEENFRFYEPGVARRERNAAALEAGNCHDRLTVGRGAGEALRRETLSARGQRANG